MKHLLYRGHTSHVRMGETPHRFAYPLLFVRVELEALESLSTRRWFCYNRRGLLSLNDLDYITRGPGSIRAKLLGVLREAHIATPVVKIVLVTPPRLLGRGFVPVSFYFLYDENSRLIGVVAEVNNTFGERHLYILQESIAPDPGYEFGFRCDKAFHVSPFYDREGSYEFHFTHPGNTFRARIDKVRAGQTEFSADLTGNGKSMSPRHIVATLLRRPFSLLLTMPRILAQAAHLYFRHRLPVFKKPVATHPMTIQIPKPNRLQRLACTAFFRRLDKIQRGGISVSLPDGTARSVGPLNAHTPAQMHIRSWRFFSLLARRGDVGFGEAWTEGEWDTDDLAGLLMVLARNQTTLQGAGLRKRGIARMALELGHRVRANHRRNSKKNIAAHYDMGNDFFGAWLDETMTYSAALFTHENEPLADAQRRKYRTLMERINLTSDHHVLEIGCGWGGFALEAVRHTGCTVTAITLSKEQHRMATDRVAAAGLSDRISIELMDYRDLNGSFDRIVSIEMIEAVGHQFFDTYFSGIERLLKPTGMAAIQAITIPDQRYEAYRKGCDWIQQYIFPGGHLPSLSAIGQSLARSTRDLTIDRVDNYPEHYAETLRRWRTQFDAAWDDLSGHGYDESFRRTWLYYLAYCEAGFQTRQIHLLQLVLTRGSAVGSNPLACAPLLEQTEIPHE